MEGSWQLSGRWVVITGATGGIGLAALRALAQSGAKLAIVGRDPARLERTAAELRERGARAVATFAADLTLLAEVRRLAAELQRELDDLAVLVNNAGAIYSRYALTPEGFERTWALNHLAPFLLTNLLLAKLASCAPAKVIATASDAHRGARLDLAAPDSPERFGFAGFARYAQTKLANILFTLELAQRLADREVGAYCFHPGFVATGFNRNNGPLAALAMTLARPFARSPQEGARTLVWLVRTPPAELVSGAYYADCRIAKPSAAGQDLQLARELWERSAAQVGLSPQAAGPSR